MLIFFGIIAVIFIMVIVLFCRRRQLLSLFRSGNVIVTGLRGAGKDMLFSFVTNSIVRGKRNKHQYVSNIDYTSGKGFVPFVNSYFSLGGNRFENFVAGRFIPYEYPLPDGVDYFLSDGGVYFPAQYFSMLDKLYPSAPLMFALSRHLGDCNIHVNVQNLNRLWDKIREQSDTYILCRSCRVIGRFAIQKITVYDNYDSAVARRRPFVRSLFAGREMRMRMAEYRAQYGYIQDMTIVHRIPKQHYNDRIFKDYLSRGYM